MKCFPRKPALFLHLASVLGLMAFLSTAVYATDPPKLSGIPGKATLEDGKLVVAEAEGEPGKQVEVKITLPNSDKIEGLTVNGENIDFKQTGAEIYARVQFAGVLFAADQQIGQYDPKFADAKYEAAITIPDWIVKAASEKAENAGLKLFVRIDQAKDDMAVSLKVDDQTVDLHKDNVAGADGKKELAWWADLSSVKANVRHHFTVELPSLKPGQFKGLFLNNPAQPLAKKLIGLPPDPNSEEQIVKIDPPKQDYFAKVLTYDGIPIMASEVVTDEALFEVKRRMTAQLQYVPIVRANLRDGKAAFHIIGKDQGTSDLPEFRHLKGKPFDGNLTIDQRARGMGGHESSCGEENLLKLPNDRYRGRDICKHEFAHCIFGFGFSNEIRKMFQQQLDASLKLDRWTKSYAATNNNEFFAEMTMWYFGTHGDLSMKGAKPENGTEGLIKYDPDGYKLVDDFYQGRLETPRIEPRSRFGGGRNRDRERTTAASETKNKEESGSTDKAASSEKPSDKPAGEKKEEKKDEKATSSDKPGDAVKADAK